MWFFGGGTGIGGVGGCAVAHRERFLCGESGMARSIRLSICW